MSSALAAAWAEANLIHRDIKPANILLGESVDDGLPFNAKLCDFGLAKFRERTMASEEMLTNTGVAVGTPHYMSPEQATGDRTADQRHDIYGLAATVYHALLGKTLYSGGSSAVIMYKQATASLDIRPLQRRGISAELVDLLSAMLAKPRERRIADWQLVLKRIDQLPPLQSTSSTRRTSSVISNFVEHSDRVKRDSDRHSEAVPMTPEVSQGHESKIQLFAIFLIAVMLCLGIAGGIYYMLGADSSANVILAQPGQQAHQLLQSAKGQNLGIHLASGDWSGDWKIQDLGRNQLLQGDGMTHTQLRGRVIVDVGTGTVTLRGLSLTVGQGAGIELRSGRVVMDNCLIRAPEGIGYFRARTPFLPSESFCMLVSGRCRYVMKAMPRCAIVACWQSRQGSVLKVVACN